MTPDPLHHTDGVQMGQEEVHHHHIGLDMGDRVHNLPSVFFHGFDIQAVRTHGRRAGIPKASLLSASSTLIFFSILQKTLHSFFATLIDYHKMEINAIVWKKFFSPCGEKIEIDERKSEGTGRDSVRGVIPLWFQPLFPFSCRSLLLFQGLRDTVHGFEHIFPQKSQSLWSDR